MTIGTLLIWLVIGLAVGFVARKMLGGASPFGAVGDIILGGAGGVVGGYLLAYIVKPATVGGLITTYIAAAAGAAVLVWLSGNMKSKG